MDPQQAAGLLETSKYGFLAVGGDANDYGYGAPLDFAYDPAAGLIYFHCAPEGAKLEALARNPRVSFCVVGRAETDAARFRTLYESVMVFGRIRQAASDDEKRTGLRYILRKYSPEHLDAGGRYAENALSRVCVLVLDVEHICGKHCK